MEHQDWLGSIIIHHLKNHPIDDFMDISGTTCLNSPSDSLWLTQPWGSIPLLIKSSHQIKSSFHFYPHFPMMSHCVSFYYSFFSDLSSDSSCYSKMELSGIFLTHWWAIAYRYQKCCLVVHDSLLYIMRLSCLRERTIRFRITLSSAFVSKVFSSTVLITASGFVILFSSRSQPLWLHDQSVSISHHQAYFSIRSQRLRISFKEYIEYFLHYTNFEAVLVFHIRI